MRVPFLIIVSRTKYVSTENFWKNEKQNNILQGAANVCVGDECVQAGFCSENLCNTIENFKEMANSDFYKTPWSFIRGSSKRFLNLITWTRCPKSHIGPLFVIPNNYEESYENVLFLCIHHLCKTIFHILIYDK